MYYLLKFERGFFFFGEGEIKTTIPFPSHSHPAVVSTLCCRQISQARLLVGIFLVGLCRPWYFGSFFPRLGDFAAVPMDVFFSQELLPSNVLKNYNLPKLTHIANIPCKIRMRLEDDSFLNESVPALRGHSFSFFGG